MLACRFLYATYCTFKNIQNDLHVGREHLDVLHTGQSPDGNKLIAVHLRHQVQVLAEVLSVHTGNTDCAVLTGLSNRDCILPMHPLYI